MAPKRAIAADEPPASIPLSKLPKPDLVNEAKQTPTEVLSTEQILQKLRLRRIVKENHGGDILQVAFNFEDGDYLQNMVATVGSDQLNIYDNEHVGDHLDIVSHYVHEASDGRNGNDVICCCWIKAVEDATIAIGCSDGNILLISVARSAVLRKYEGHNGTVSDIIAGRGIYKDFLWSASSDNTIRCWNIESGSCKVILESPAYALSISVDGSRLFSGSKTETLAWNIDSCLTDNNNPVRRDKGHGIVLERKGTDCLMVVGDTLFCKSLNGKFDLFSTKSFEPIKSFSASSTANSCRFDVSRDGQFLCVGDTDGKVSIISVPKGKVIATLHHKRSAKPVRACAFTYNCKSVLYVGGDCCWRYDYIDDETLQVFKS